MRACSLERWHLARPRRGTQANRGRARCARSQALASLYVALAQHVVEWVPRDVAYMRERADGHEGSAGRDAGQLQSTVPALRQAGLPDVRVGRAGARSLLVRLLARRWPRPLTLPGPDASTGRAGGVA